jgi:DNA helicase-2/ATP-dependent DNA helicase PcrA
LPSRFIGELPADHIQSENTMTGGASLWRAQWSERDDPFAHLARKTPDSRGPGWQRAATQYDPTPPRKIASPTRSAASFAAKPRLDIKPGDSVFHEKFGQGVIAAQEGNKLEIDFETHGRKRVLDSFVRRLS